MIWNKIHTKIYVLIRICWKVICEAMAPRWTSLIPPAEPITINKDLLEKSDNQSQVEDVSDSLSDGEDESTSSLCSDHKEEEHHAFVDMDEYAKLMKRMKELEEESSFGKAVSHTLKELRECSKRELQNSGKIGRPSKQHKRVTFNLQQHWSLLYELGVKMKIIKLGKTEFYNSAIEAFLKNNYNKLYQVYVRSITDDNPEDSHQD